jgi:nucleotide-binding universal stress UspA family protein
MLLFAYDGTIHGDWVGHYAVRLASHDPERLLRVIHVDEGKRTDGELEEHLGRLSRFADVYSVKIQTEIVRGRREVFTSLAEKAAEARDCILMCGARSKPRARGLLSGTVSQRLLRDTRIPVVAMRVVQPGLLGAPRNLLLPVSGHPRGMALAMSFLGLFAPDLTRIHILLVKPVGSYWFRHMAMESRERLRGEGRMYCERVEQELTKSLGLEKSQLDATVVVSDDPPTEILVHANRTRSRLILMGASERSLAQRFWYGNPVEHVLRNSACDVAIYRGVP